uniref:adenosylcobinamide amidohydrolase n=1 Tax=uncultured Megasphaera sp. TaxID=165188 RepID=UPI0025EFA052
MKLLELPGGDKLHHYQKSLVLCFAGPRDVLSTGPIGGGFRADLQAVFNNDCNPGAGMSCELRADTYEEHMELLALTDLGLNPKLCTGLSTAASMDHVAIRSMSYEDFTVTAIVTGGIRVNGSRVGDPAVWHEKAGISHSTT